MQKVEASKIFKDQKDSYSQSVGRLFLDSRLGICWYMHSLPPCVLQTVQVMYRENTQHLRRFSHCFVQNVNKSISKWCRLSGMTKCRWDLQGFFSMMTTLVPGNFSAASQSCVSFRFSVWCLCHKVWQEGFQASPSPAAAHKHLCCACGQDKDQTEDGLLSYERWKPAPSGD